jgi:hypothetical protein
MTALATLPTPDCRGSSSGGSRSAAISCRRKSTRWAAIAFESSSAGLNGRFRSGCVRLDDGDDLGRIDPQVGVADALHRLEQLDRQPLGRAAGSVVDVVEAFVGPRMPGVDLEDHLVGEVEPGLRVPDGAAGHEQPVGQDRGHLDDGDVEVAVEAEPGLLGRMAEVGVDVFGRPGVDRGPHRRVRLERQTLAHGTRLGEDSVEFGGGRGAGPQFDAEVVIPRVMGRASAFGHRTRHAFG